MSRLAAALAIVGLLIAGAAAPTTADTSGVAVDRYDGPVVVAHRGSSGVVPENTVAAIRQAHRHSSDVVENDIQRTSDDELVIMHDVSLARTTDVEQVFPDRAPWNVGDFTLAEIKRLDAGSWFAPEFAGERVPTLAEWATAVGSRARMLLEPKSPELYPGIAEDLDHEIRTTPALRAAARAGRLVVQSFNHEWLRGYQALAPDVPVGLLFGAKPTAADIAAAATWADQVNPALGVIDEATVDLVHTHGLEIHVWTVNDGQGMRRAHNWDVDGIITNYPQVLVDIIRRG